MNESEFKDLAKLTRKRTREAAMSVGQLADDDMEKAALLVSVVVDFIQGATMLMADDDDEDVSEQEALGTVLGMVFSLIGIEKVADALRKVRREQRR